MPQTALDRIGSDGLHIEHHGRSKTIDELIVLGYHSYLSYAY